MVKGIIVKGIGGLYIVDAAGKLITCRARGKFRISNMQPMVGDVVNILTQETGASAIVEILPRKNSLIRPALANIDALMIIVSAAPPITETFLIDKICSIAGHKNIEAIICINKIDLQSGSHLYDIYTKAGFKVLCVSAQTGDGIDLILDELKGKITALTGNSGVGKSSILNAIDPSQTIATAEISSKIGRGKNTTRHVELFPVKSGGYIADTPGFSSFEVERMDLVLKNQLQYAFIDFRKYIPMCRYTGCTHINERDCAIIEAVRNGEIGRSRYDSYVMLYNSMKDFKEWELKKQTNA